MRSSLVHNSVNLELVTIMELTTGHKLIVRFVSYLKGLVLHADTIKMKNLDDDGKQWQTPDNDQINESEA